MDYTLRAKNHAMSFYYRDKPATWQFLHERHLNIDISTTLIEVHLASPSSFPRPQDPSHVSSFFSIHFGTSAEPEKERLRASPHYKDRHCISARGVQRPVNLFSL
jgi:hypothetical protein